MILKSVYPAVSSGMSTSPLVDVLPQAHKRALSQYRILGGAHTGVFRGLLGRTRTLESHASRVRKKLCVDPSDTFVVNVWGFRGGWRRVSGSCGKWLLAWVLDTL